jgi:hypothetical protein
MFALNRYEFLYQVAESLLGGWSFGATRLRASSLSFLPYPPPPPVQNDNLSNTVVQILNCRREHELHKRGVS